MKYEYLINIEEHLTFHKYIISILWAMDQQINSLLLSLKSNWQKLCISFCTEHFSTVNLLSYMSLFKYIWNRWIFSSILSQWPWLLIFLVLLHSFSFRFWLQGILLLYLPLFSFSQDYFSFNCFPVSIWGLMIISRAAPFTQIRLRIQLIIIT